MSIEIDSTPVVRLKDDDSREGRMEVVAAPPSGGGVPPFCDHDVREWSRIDGITGAFERARLETDRWSASMGNTSYKYGKVVGSKNLTAADGGLRQSAKRQLEVFQGRVAGAQLHLVRTSSQWTSASSITRNSNGDFENLQLSHNPLDLTSQKSKASVGRSVTRRPPTRQRLKDQTPPSIDAVDRLRHAHLSAATNLHRVSRLCHQIHDNAVRQAFGSGSRRPAIAERQDGDGRVEIVEIENETGHTNLSRTKSTSSDDIHLVAAKDTGGNRSVNDLEDLEQLQTWRRTSKLRRSLQFPKQTKPATSTKQADLPENTGSVRKLREDLEKGRRLNTALRNNSIDLEALDQILQSISGSSTCSEKTIEDGESDTPTKQKKNSFVTVESIKEVKERLRRTSSPSSDIYKVNGLDLDPDDGIVTEETPPDKEVMPLAENSRVRSYVYGMEAMMNKKPSIGTGSLESRVKLVNGNSSTNRSEDWYNRRKSYGFEQVHGHSESTNSISLRDKKLVESSTDSGICRSTEIVLVPNARKNGYNSDELSESEKSTGYEHTNHAGRHTGQVKKLANNFVQDENYEDSWNKYQTEWSYPKNELKSTTITIPIAKNNNVVELSWTDPDKETKRHSIAVDESKYVTKFDAENTYRRTSLASNDQLSKQDDEDSNTRKTKKVEFCKTEVHFAAESGKVNIVATDEKPPPTQNFRRRRRNSGPTLEDFNKNGLPVRHFGDSCFEKTMFGISDDSTKTSIYDDVRPSSSFCGLVTVSTINSSHSAEAIDEEKKELENELKGILKNKPVKPRPYHLGQSVLPMEDGATDDDNKWGIKLRHVEKPDTPIWKSTVTVQNYNYIDDNKEPEKEKEPEFQKLLKNLRPIRKNDYTSDSDNIYIEDSKRPEGGGGQTVEVKGYSTKINFGEGEATVVKNNENLEPNRHAGSTGNDSKLVLNRGLVVRIGRQDSALNHTVCSKMTTTREPNSTTTTTTKITIDLSRSPPFKSTSLILDTIKDRGGENKGRWRGRDEVPRQLEALRKMYEDVHSDDSEADKEVQLLMCNMSENVVGDGGIDDRGSEVSGSWSRMRAYKNLSEHFGRGAAKGCDNASAKVEKDSKDKVRSQDNPTKINVNQAESKYSPIASRKSIPTLRPNLKFAEKLSSPSIVNRSKTAEYLPIEKNVPNKDFQRVEKKLHPSDSIVLRQPKKSEMTYFGVNISPKPTKRISHAVIRKESKISIRPQDESGSLKQNSRQKTPEPPEGPVYENVKNRYGRDFDSSILEELTKAADQILQAVNGYTDEDSHNRLSSDDEDPKKEHLETIVESKSWKQRKPSADKLKPTPSKPRLGHSSSNSSVDSISRRTNRAQQPRRRTERTETTSAKAATKARRLQRASSREALLQCHGSSSEDLPAKVEVPLRKPRLVKKTKAVQLSVTNGLEVRKSPSSTASRKRDEVNKKAEERIMGSLPEIRHKTAVSTIRSTSEKVARDKSRYIKNEDLKKKQIQQKKETSRVSSLSSRGEKEKDSRSSTVNHKETVTHRISTANIKKCYRANGGTRH